MMGDMIYEETAMEEQAVEKAVALTEAAADAVKEMLATQATPMYLRVYVSGGGCSGLQYGLALDESDEEDDVIVKDHGVEIRIDPISLKHMSGATVDFVPTEMGGAFKVDNPQPPVACGCGKSFQAEGAPPGGCGGCNSCGE